MQYLREFKPVHDDPKTEEFVKFLGLDKPPRKPQRGYHTGVEKYFKYDPATDTMEWSDEYIE